MSPKAAKRMKGKLHQAVDAVIQCLEPVKDGCPEYADALAHVHKLLEEALWCRNLKKPYDARTCCPLWNHTWFAQLTTYSVTWFGLIQITVILILMILYNSQQAPPAFSSFLFCQRKLA